MREGSTSGCVERLRQLAELRLQRRAHEVVGVVDDERDARMVLLVDAARILRRNDDGAIELAVAHVLHRLLIAVVVRPGLKVRALDCTAVERLADLHRLRAVVLIDHAQPRVFDLAAEGIAQHDELHQRKHHRHQHQRRRAEELAQLAFDDGQHSVHGRIPGRSA